MSTSLKTRHGPGAATDVAAGVADTAAPMALDEALALVAEPMQAVNTLIRERLASDVVLINQLAHYIIEGGGKRLRPQLVLLAAAASGLEPDHRVHTVAAIIELIHTATLLHDDVVDASELRRGRDTANALWGNEAAVLVGDFLYSRAFEMMVDIDSMQVMKILASTTNRIAEGEVMQLLNVREPDLSEADYVRVIQAKTARLFQAATELGGVLAGRDATVCAALANYGMHLGTAFQIADDVLDYQGERETLGKNHGDDLAEGKNTLPLIYAMAEGDAEQRELVARAIREADPTAFDAVCEVIASTNAVRLSLQRAAAEADRAVETLTVVPPSRWRDALAALAHHAVSRSA